jgi:hypothetical protein
MSRLDPMPKRIKRFVSRYVFAVVFSVAILAPFPAWPLLAGRLAARSFQTFSMMSAPTRP